MRYKNDAGFVFIWPESSNIVEVFHARVSFADEPFEVVDMQGTQRSDSNLKKLANSTPEYATL